MADQGYQQVNICCSLLSNPDLKALFLIQAVVGESRLTKLHNFTLYLLTNLLEANLAGNSRLVNNDDMTVPVISSASITFSRRKAA